MSECKVPHAVLLEVVRQRVIKIIGERSSRRDISVSDVHEAVQSAAYPMRETAIIDSCVSSDVFLYRWKQGIHFVSHLDVPDFTLRAPGDEFYDPASGKLIGTFVHVDRMNGRGQVFTCDHVGFRANIQVGFSECKSCGYQRVVVTGHL